MLDTSLGQILVADHQGVYIIKMRGDVRLTLSVSFDHYIETLFQKNDFCTIVFDLEEAVGLDSTTLGLIAKIAIKSHKIKNISPVIICPKEDILILLSSMGIDVVCQIIDAPSTEYCSIDGFDSLTNESLPSEHQVRDKVLEAHCVLMGLNDTNKETFKDLVAALQ